MLSTTVFADSSESSARLDRSLNTSIETTPMDGDIIDGLQDINDSSTSKQAEIVTTPILDKSDGDHGATVETEENICPICHDRFDGLQESELLRLPCKHIFHANCLRLWLNRCNTCPTCRAVNPEPPGNYKRVIVARRDAEGFFELQRRDSIQLLIEQFERERAAEATRGCRAGLSVAFSTILRYIAQGASQTSLNIFGSPRSAEMV